MTEDISAHLRLSTMVCFAAALVAVVVNITVMCMGVMTLYTNKYSNAVVDATQTQIHSIAASQSVAAPIAYSVISRGIDDIDRVYLTTSEGTTKLYEYTNQANDSLMTLLNVYSTSEVMVRVTTGEMSSGMYTVKLEVVER